jgi:crotonobetainyl-CoA:carnitine CoA-transferase CaiB-like acyl-CoA transferase
VQRLSRNVDIVMDNLAAGVMAKNSLAYDDLIAENPNIIVVSMSMAGQEGPLRGMRGFASIATGYSGMELMVGYPEVDTSTGLLPFGLGDTTMAIQAVVGALVALHERADSGQGQFVDVSQMDSAASTLGEPLLAHQLAGDAVGPQGNTHTRYFPHGIFPAEGEERWLALAARDENEWHALCAAIGRDDWAKDASLADASGRRERAAEIDGAIEAWCSGRERDAAVEALVAAGVPASPVFELEERNEHRSLPHLRHTVALQRYARRGDPQDANSRREQRLRVQGAGRAGRRRDRGAEGEGRPGLSHAPGEARPGR